MAQRRSPFDVAVSPDFQQRLALWVCDQIQDGLSARATQESEVDYWTQLYEQAKTRQSQRPDAADLTSYLACEKVDALHARMMKTIMVEPICTVDGFGEAASRADIVEEFHQWKADSEERIQGVLDRLIQQALIEPRGLLEVYEGAEMRVTRKTMSVAVERHPETGAPIFDEKGEPVLQQDGGRYVPAGPEDMAAEAVVDDTDYVRTGPSYRLLPYRDSLVLPGHARDRNEIWGYCKRFYKRYDTLMGQAARGIYDTETVRRMTDTGERKSEPALSRAHMDVVQSTAGRSEKELWECTLLLDLQSLGEEFGIPVRDRKLRGERWYVLTVHPSSQQLLRIQHDDAERSRFVIVNLFPRHDRVTEGYSFVGNKLITVVEEHTAWRNMDADRGAMVVQAPIKRMQGALWDPEESPWGAGTVIDVRDPREIEPMVIPDLTNVSLQRIQLTERTAERLAGINDVASGSVAQESRTLGEVQMATEQSFVRMDLVVNRFREALEDIYQIRHAILKRTLAERPDGVELPSFMAANLEGRGMSIDSVLPDKKLTAMMLEGTFRFKPHGSVETADISKQRNDLIGLINVLPMILQVFPSLAPVFQTPQAARAIMQQLVRTFRFSNPQALLGSLTQTLQTGQQMAGMPPAGMMPPAPPMGMGAPGMPPGAPPMGGPPMGGPPPQAVLDQVLGGGGAPSPRVM